MLHEIASIGNDPTGIEPFAMHRPAWGGHVFSDVTLSEHDKSMAASCLAFAFLMTDDTLYRDKGIEALTSIGNGSFDGLMFNWHAGAIGTNDGLAYDWLYNGTCISVSRRKAVSIFPGTAPCGRRRTTEAKRWSSGRIS
jgi:hypothetical protein